MSTSKDMRSSIENTTRQYLNAYKDVCEANDPSVINRHVTEDCKRHFLPKGVMDLFLVPVGVPLDNASYQGAITKDMAKSRFTNVAIANLAIDTEARKAVATTTTEITYRDGDVHVVEHCWIFEFNVDGTKVSNIVEFCDMDSTRRMVEKVYTQEEIERGLVETFQV
ncbi:unnamed protein product [Fusarium equiseti]|uniref:SnoaL-like domain-containing protein n=1 Tax=Fusarium equiseti TaxID=61235 RepID=A0A8J2IPF3_FUSEQ|nr:unnamed protein product [Fusarium equiseti]